MILCGNYENGVMEQQILKPTENLAKMKPGRNDGRGPYMAPRYMACNHTNKELRNILKKFYNLSEPNKCCFRGSKHLTEKNT